MIKALATFWLAKLFVHERAGEPLRRCFKIVIPPSPTRDYFLGCTRCVGFWAAIVVHLLPRRAVSVFATAGANDILQATFRMLCTRGNEKEGEGK